MVENSKLCQDSVHDMDPLVDFHFTFVASAIGPRIVGLWPGKAMGNPQPTNISEIRDESCENMRKPFKMASLKLTSKTIETGNNKQQ